ncbi:exosortase P [Leifsonia kafniensis]|uniref:Exosortase P n=2 Tax=Leifsonia kafniensis TaxID=475957 RepID=A0ABP7KFE4_9MICO
MRRTVRALVGVALAAGGVLLMLNHALLRQTETVLAAALADAVTPGSMYVVPGSFSFFWASATPEMHGLRITPECTVAFLVGPLLILAGLILASGRFSLSRTLLATTLSAGVLVLANQARIVLIAWATAKWGVADGYQWSHTVGGSVVVGIGVALALTAFIIALTAGRRRSRGQTQTPRHSAVGHRAS